ncbi:MAG: DDE-type integrase/transposase/recombinase [Candidatus Bathyarchaeia archaeon]
MQGRFFCNSLWHTDWKQLDDSAWLLAYIDDASMLVVGYGVFKEVIAENALKVLKEALAKYKYPKEILTDWGSQFYANEGGLKEKGDKSIRGFSMPSWPQQTNRKFERFYGLCDQNRHQFEAWRNT